MTTSHEPDWDRLHRLREQFLRDADGPRTIADYWRDERDLAAYDAILAARIGWKWDAVLDELEERGITIPATRILDWGCGSGIATRRVLATKTKPVPSVQLHDRSTDAMQFAVERVASEHPDVSVATAPRIPIDEHPDLLLLSHVLNELNAATEERLLDLVRRAEHVLWVEPGTHAVARRLAAIREQLAERFDILAPCTHAKSCPTLAGDRDWCHFFAAPPTEVFTDPDWVRAGRTLGVDLRSLPYSFLALRKRTAEPHPPSAAARLIGRPYVRKKLARTFLRDADGLHERSIVKPDDPELFRQLKKDPPRLLPRDGG